MSQAPLRAVFLDIGETIMRPNPSWEHVYAMAFEEFGYHVDIDDLHAALRRAYHHGGWGMDGGFEPTEETSFRRTVEIDAAAIAELGLQPMPESFYRRLSELFMVTSHWHIFPDAYPTLSALQNRGLVVGAVSNWASSTSSPPAHASASKSRTPASSSGRSSRRTSRPNRSSTSVTTSTPMWRVPEGWASRAS